MLERVVKLSLISAALVLGTLAFVGNSTSTSASTATGAELFGAKCAMCHGRNGAGMPNWRSKGQPDFTDDGWQKAHSDTQIAESISNGKGKFMPSFKGKLSPEEINALVGQVRTFGKKR
ncbi:MAG TPA: c-type cytochrome [Blastocatellia bacterium]|nr:c-type cytochrome [Blastocatellia bacterium]